MESVFAILRIIRFFFLSSSLELAWTQIMKAVSMLCVVTDISAQFFWLSVAVFLFSFPFSFLSWHPGSLYSSREKIHDKRYVCVHVWLVLNFAWGIFTVAGLYTLRISLPHCHINGLFLAKVPCFHISSLSLASPSEHDANGFQGALETIQSTPIYPNCLSQTNKVIYFDFEDFHLLWRILSFASSGLGFLFAFSIILAGIFTTFGALLYLLWFNIISVSYHHQRWNCWIFKNWHPKTRNLKTIKITWKRFK